MPRDTKEELYDQKWTYKWIYKMKAFNNFNEQARPSEFKKNRSNLLLIACLILTACIFACTKKKSEPENPQLLLIEQGRKTYIAHCISCHNINPRVDGAIGPAVVGSSLELLSAKVLAGEYPTGYKPRRETKAMAPLPMLRDQITALHAFLQN